MEPRKRTIRAKLLLTTVLVLAMWLSIPLIGSWPGQTTDLTAQEEVLPMQFYFIPNVGGVCYGGCHNPEAVCCAILLV